MDALIDALLDWIADNSDYSTEVPHPIVLQLTPQELTRELYTGVAHLIPEGGVDDRVNALYAFDDGPHGTIYILRAEGYADAAHFDDPTDNPLWREVLLHELVHHVQWQTGEAETWACPAQGERAAYALGGQYLHQAHARDPMGNRAFWGHLYSRC